MPTTCPPAVSACVFALRAENLGDAEVGNLHPALFVEQDILRLDVPVHDALVVRVLQRLADLRHDGQSFLRRHPPAPEQLPQGQAIHELHQQIIAPLHLAKIIHRDNLRVIEPGQGARLALEPLGELGITLLFRRQELQRHQPIQPRLARLINRAHAAATEKANDLEVREKLRHLGYGKRGLRRLVW